MSSPASSSPNGSDWHSTACVLCSINCGLEVQTEGRHIKRLRGDKAHPGSQGYTCEKPRTLDLYQNAKDRITTPLRRAANGSFEPVDWDTAIREVAERLAAIRDEHGGDKILYYGGGGQGNHLCGAYAASTRAAMGNVFASNALAQEKTGEFWVDGQLFGSTACHTTGDFEEAEVAIFLGKNPWQSHGFPRARVVLREIAKDPARSLIVIDPRRTETAELADHHLAVRPAGDAHLLAALLAVLLEEELVDSAFLEERTTDSDGVFAALRKVDVREYCERAGVPEEQVREVARRIARASSVSIFEDLGIQQAPHSTLASYLEKLIYLVTGNFGKRGAMNIHTRMAGLGGGRSGGKKTSPVTRSRIISGLIPCNAVSEEILTDHPDRFRAMFVESANPAHSLADSARMREALDALDFVVVIDVAMTETARHADYILPAASQFEKWEATFFTLEFPENYFHLRSPVFEPLEGSLPEAEIHRRLTRALGGLEGEDLSDLRAAAERGLSDYAAAFLKASAERKQLGAHRAVVLYETLGPALPAGAEAAAVMWGAAQMCALANPDAVRRAGYQGDGPELGNALFRAVLEQRSGIVFTVDEYDATWERIAHADDRIHLTIPDLIPELESLVSDDPRKRDADFPFVLAAGERRSTTANTIYRDPAWRRKDGEGALRIHPEDAARLGIAASGRARVTTRKASLETAVELTDQMPPGMVSLPNGLGLDYAEPDTPARRTGVPPNELTSLEDRDWLAGTPWHKHVRARVEAV